MKRQYGKSRTNLTLSNKASELYSGSDPFEIYEYEDYIEDTDEAVYTYSYKAWGDPETRRMTEDELNADLEALADAMNDEEED